MWGPMSHFVFIDNFLSKLLNHIQQNTKKSAMSPEIIHIINDRCKYIKETILHYCYYCHELSLEQEIACILGVLIQVLEKVKSLV